MEKVMEKVMEKLHENIMVLVVDWAKGDRSEGINDWMEGRVSGAIHAWYKIAITVMSFEEADKIVEEYRSMVK